jgi:hypothetical protein
MRDQDKVTVYRGSEVLLQIYDDFLPTGHKEHLPSNLASRFLMGSPKMLRGIELGLSGGGGVFGSIQTYCRGDKVAQREEEE